MLVCSVVVVTVLGGCAAGSRTSRPESHTAQRLIDQGVLHLRSNDLSRAEASFFAAYELQPTAPALDGLGSVSLLRKEYESAERFFRQAIQHDGRYPRAYGNLALLLEITGRRREALHYYRVAITLDPEIVAIRNNYAALLYDNRGDGSMGERAALSRVRGELLKADALRSHPIVRNGLAVLQDLSSE